MNSVLPYVQFFNVVHIVIAPIVIDKITIEGHEHPMDIVEFTVVGVVSVCVDQMVVVLLGA